LFIYEDSSKIDKDDCIEEIDFNQQKKSRFYESHYKIEPEKNFILHVKSKKLLNSQYDNLEYELKV
jgi:hypothetical protein